MLRLTTPIIPTYRLLHGATKFSLTKSPFKLQRKLFSTQNDMKNRNKKLFYILGTITVAVLGVSYAAVPLYKVFCQVTGFGGTTRKADEEMYQKLKPVKDGVPITVRFETNTYRDMPWEFKPVQRTMTVIPGETALAFFHVHNPMNYPVVGVATYNVAPSEVGVYFNKIQCFCFEEQRLSPNEHIDMPVFFFIDPEFADDPTMKNVNEIALTYTFFKTAEEVDLVEKEEEVQKMNSKENKKTKKIAASSKE